MKAIFIFAISLIACFSNAQSDAKEVSIHDFNQQINKFPEVMTFAKNEEGNFFIWKKEHSTSFNGKSENFDFVELRDENMEVVKFLNINEHVKGGERQLLGSRLFNGHLILFTRQENSDETYTLSMQAIDINSLEVLDRKELLKGKMHKGSERYIPHNMPYAMATPPIESCISPNGNFMMLAVRGLYERKKTESISLLVINNDLELDWSKENYTIDAEDRYYFTLSFTIGNVGEIFMLGGLNNVEKPNLDLYRFHEGDVLKESIAYTHKPKKYQLQLGVNNDNNLVLAGCYSDGTPTITAGNMIAIYDSESLKVLDESKNKFDEKTLLYGLNEREIETFKDKVEDGKDVGVSNLEMDSIIFNNGAFYVVNRRVSIPSYNLDGPNYTDYEILVSKYNLSGELEFVSKIARVQSKSASRLHKTFVYYATENGLEFIFADMPENLEKDFNKEKPLGHYVGKCLVSHTISSTGESNRTMIYNSAENHKKYFLFDFEICESTDNEVVVVMNFGKEEGTNYVLIK